MVLLVLFVFEGFRTIIFLFTHKWFCTIPTVAFNTVMRSLVNIVIRTIGESSSADFTLITELSNLNFHVTLQTRRCCEVFSLGYTQPCKLITARLWRLCFHRNLSYQRGKGTPLVLSLVLFQSLVPWSSPWTSPWSCLGVTSSPITGPVLGYPLGCAISVNFGRFATSRCERFHCNTIVRHAWVGTN